VGDLVRPDHPKGTGQTAQAAAGALFYIKSRPFPFFVQGLRKAYHCAVGLFAVMAKNRNRSRVSDIMHIDMSFASMHALAGYLTGPTAYASADVYIYRHFIPLEI
jgi:hypothetical protein